MTAKTALATFVWGAAGYLAAVWQVRMDAAGPNLPLAVAAAWLHGHPGARGVLGVAVAGLLLDALGNGRLGLHLGTCGVLATLADMTALHGRAWSRPLFATWLAFTNHTLAVGLQAMVLNQTFELSDTVQQAGHIAAWTGGIVVAAQVLVTLVRRSVRAPSNIEFVRLHNRWHRLTET